MPEEYLAGKITHYFGNIGVAVVALSASLKKGSAIHLKGKNTDFTQTVESMQVEHKEISEAKPGDDVGMKINERVREGDEVYLVQ